MDTHGIINHLVPEYQKIIPKHFDHANTFTRRINLVNHLIQIHELGARNYMVKQSGISILSPFCFVRLTKQKPGLLYRIVFTIWVKKGGFGLKQVKYDRMEWSL
jgi:hypothetical protein